MGLKSRQHRVNSFFLDLVESRAGVVELGSAVTVSDPFGLSMS
jgi:hypothetical protein